MARGVHIKDHWREQRMFDQRAVVAAAIIVILTLGLLSRLFLLQVVRHDYYAQLSQGNRVRTEPIPATRGLILDRHAEVIAANQPAYQLELIPEEVPDLSGELDGLVKLDLIRAEDVDELKRTIRSHRVFDTVPVKLRMSDEDVATFAVRRFEFPGLDIKTRQTRSYPYGDLAVHALGYVGAISEADLKHINAAAYAGTSLIGKLGVESAYETQLHGTNGSREILVNAQGRSVDKQGAFAPTLDTHAPTAGNDIILSLDLNVQRTAEEALAGKRGAVVAIDPNNGDILTLASRPGFDPTLFARGITKAEYAALSNDIDKPLLNRALRGTYPSGSTIKPVLALAALTNHTVDPEHKVFCNGVFYLPGSAHQWREDKDGPHGWLALQEAISRSSDIYFYGLASNLGIERISSFLARFGYGQLTGIDISGEKPGLLPTPEWKFRVYKDKWYPGETVNIGIGQGYLLVTPLQLAHITSVLAERGKGFRPRLVRALRDINGQERFLAPVPDKTVTGVADADWNLAINGMIGATRCDQYCGTAWVAFKGVNYTVAGKTGTAQVFTVAQNAKYNAKTLPERLRDHAWFVAFAPAQAPRIAVAVLVENAGFGSTGAAPIARKVLDAYLLGPDGKLKADPSATGPDTSDPQEAPPVSTPAPELDQKRATLPQIMPEPAHADG